MLHGKCCIRWTKLSGRSIRKTTRWNMLPPTSDSMPQEYFQMTGIQCELDIPAQLPAYPLSSQMRHHLFLATHEALTNILKHSNATHAKISMVCGQATFEINISDDGKGFNLPANDLQTGVVGAGRRRRPEQHVPAPGRHGRSLLDRVRPRAGNQHPFCFCH